MSHRRAVQTRFPEGQMAWVVLTLTPTGEPIVDSVWLSQEGAMNRLQWFGDEDIDVVVQEAVLQ